MSQVSSETSRTNTAVSSARPVVYPEGLLKSYSGGTVRQGDDQFFMTARTKPPTVSPQVTADMGERIMTINDTFSHLKKNFLWVVDYFANASIPDCVSDLDQAIAREQLKTSAAHVLEQSDKFTYP